MEIRVEGSIGRISFTYSETREPNKLITLLSLKDAIKNKSYMIAEFAMENKSGKE